MLRVIPLGGLGEIGLNCMLFESGDEMVLVDAGVMFPTHAQPGVDVVVPDFTYLLANAHKLKGVFLTHGHEDHVGALPWLLRQVPMPVYGTRYTLGFLRSRLEEAGVQSDLREVEPRESVRVGRHFTAEAVRVTHSVPDAVGYLLDTPEGTVVHTGDFKLDPDPTDGKFTDLERLGEAGERGVLALLSDSTNSEVRTETPSERVVAETFQRLFPQMTGRIVVALFASNMNRVRHLVELAPKLGRKVVLLGRSMIRNVETARELGVLKVPDGLLISPEAAGGLPARQVMVLTTGSQAEPRSGLSALAQGHNDGPIRLQPGDTVVFSSSPIPGNERAVGELIDLLQWKGAKVVYNRVEPGVHVSGHASRPQQQRMLELVKPRHFLPVHGELRHLQHHLDLAREVGVEAAGLLLARNGDVVQFKDGYGGLKGTVPTGRLYQERGSEVPVGLDVIAERLRLSETGLLVAVVVIDRSNNGLMTGPVLTGQGLTPEEMALLPRVADEARGLFLELSPALRGDDALVKDELARAVRRAHKQRTGKRPAVMPLVVKI
jgi:ribonuclease J